MLVIVVFVCKHELMCCVHNRAVFNTFYGSTVANSEKGRFLFRGHERAIRSCGVTNHNAKDLARFGTVYKNRKPCNYTDWLRVEGAENAKSFK